MRAKTILSLCCFLVLLFAGAVLSAEPVPAPAVAPFLSSVQPAPVCAAVPAATPAANLGGGPVTDSACPVALWQQCYQRYGTCMLCFCLGSSCECENRCV
jgi:hypothetical protein